MASEGGGLPRAIGLMFFTFLTLGGRMYWDGFGSQRPGQKLQYMKIFGFFVFLIFVLSNLRKMRSSCEDATLNMSKLNLAVVVKEVFWNYLQAALMEPMVQIATRSSDLITHGEKDLLIMHVLMLVSLLWWTYIITDAFDESDTEQEFKFRGFAADFREKRFSGRMQRDEVEWLSTEDSKDSEHMGSWFQDLALWSVLACIASACFGMVRHTDVWHAYAIFVLWIVLHHICHSATCWGANYMVSLLMPSSALLPVQFCLLVRAAETLEDLEERREFVRTRCGVRLQIKTQVVHAQNRSKAS